VQGSKVSFPSTDVIQCGLSSVVSRNIYLKRLGNLQSSPIFVFPFVITVLRCLVIKLKLQVTTTTLCIELGKDSLSPVSKSFGVPFFNGSLQCWRMRMSSTCSMSSRLSPITRAKSGKHVFTSWDTSTGTNRVGTKGRGPS